MLHRVVILFTLALVFVSCGSEPGESAITTPKKDSIPKSPKKTDSIRDGLIYPKVMEIVRKSAYDSFHKRIGDSTYLCTYKGKFESADTTGNNRHLLFDLRAEYIIDEIYFQPLESNRFFIAWQETDHEGVSSYFAVYTRGHREPDWKMREKAPSPGQPVISGDAVYVSSLGMISKLNLNSGNPVWEHDSLFDPYKLTYKEFNTPLVYPHMVCFFDSPIRGKKNRSDSIWVNDATGKIGK